jgi:hypothetical protein
MHTSNALHRGNLSMHTCKPNQRYSALALKKGHTHLPHSPYASSAAPAHSHGTASMAVI